MRYAVISDIHSNLEALRAVLMDSSSFKVDNFICAGDIVGYAASPKECIAAVRSVCPKILIAGNHDYGVIELLDLEYFNERSRNAVLWTKGVLSQDDLDYLKTFVLLREEAKFTIVHGSLDNPGKFHYIFGRGDAYETVELMKTPVCFVGHSHVAEIFHFRENKMTRSTGPKIKIEYEDKYVINAGSIGQPRDGDPRASYAVYDDEEGTVEIRRVEYDIKAAQRKIMDAGLPLWLASRLAEGR